MLQTSVKVSKRIFAYKSKNSEVRIQESEFEAAELQNSGF